MLSSVGFDAEISRNRSRTTSNQSWRARQRFIASARNCWNFAAFSACVLADVLAGAGFSASGSGFLDRDAVGDDTAGRLTAARADGFLEELGMAVIMPVFRSPR